MKNPGPLIFPKSSIHEDMNPDDVLVLCQENIKKVITLVQDQLGGFADINYDTLLVDMESRRTFGYAVFFQLLMGNIITKETDAESFREFSETVFALFQKVRKSLKLDESIETENKNFIDRMLPFILARKSEKISLHRYQETDEYRILTNVYTKARDLFKNKKRGFVSKGYETTYLTHLKEVFAVNISLCDEFDLKNALVDLFHDVIEDTPLTAEDIRDFFEDKELGAEIAMRVKLLSKTPNYEFIDKMEELEKYKNTPMYAEAQEYFSKKSYYTQTDDKTSLAVLQKPESPATLQILKKVKSARNTAYLDDIKKLAESEYVWFDPQTLELCKKDTPGAQKIATKDILTTKFGDVNNNLATLLGMPSDDDKLRKVREAKIYILPLAEKISPKHAKIMKHWIDVWEGLLM